MQSVSSRIWIRVAVSISYGDNDNTTGTSIDRTMIDTKTREEIIYTKKEYMFLYFIKRLLLI